MHLRLGARRFDVTNRSLVAGVLDLDSGGIDSLLHGADAVVGEGADLVCVRSSPEPGGKTEDELLRAVAELVGRIGVPIGVEAGAPAAVDAIRAGASLAQCAGEPSARLAEIAAEQGAALVVAGCAGEAARSSRVSQLKAAGMAPESIVLEAPTLAAMQPLGGLGHPVQISILKPSTTDQERDTGLATVATAITAGCRLIRTRDIAGARRTAAVLAAVLEAR